MTAAQTAPRLPDDALAKLGIRPMAESIYGNDGDATEANTGRTFLHMTHTRTLSGMQYSDACIAHTVRMVGRSDWHLEAKVCMARDRILCLLEEKETLAAEVIALRADRDGWQETAELATAHVGELMFEIAARRKDCAAYKSRGDNHWETLRSIREMAQKPVPDIERIILWVNDAASGATATVEQTMVSLSDERNEAQSEVLALRKRVEAADALDTAAAATRIAISSVLIGNIRYEALGAVAVSLHKAIDAYRATVQP